MAEDATCDRGRKQMPSITTYNSDDSFDEEDLSSSLEEASKMIAEMRSFTDVQNGMLSHLSDSASNSPSTTDEDDFPDVSDKLVHMPVTQLISSEQFSAICTQRSRQCKSSTRPLSAYALFFRDVLPGTKTANPDAKFGDLARLIATKWDELPREQKREYKKRGVRLDRNGTNSLLVYKTRLLSLDSDESRRCCNPSCGKPVTWDPRWNGQYCSAACVSEHCRLAFINWCAGKRFVAATTTGPSRVPSHHGFDRVKPEATDSTAVSEGYHNETTWKPSSTSETENSSLAKKPSQSQTNRGPSPFEPPVYAKPEPPDPDSAILHRKPLFETLSFALPNSRSNSTN